MYKFNPELDVEEASMPPCDWYSDSTFLTKEKLQIFSKTWQPVARIEDLIEKDSYITGILSGLPWVITKDQAGTLHAFYNICSHKGREVVTGKGSAKNCELTCGYHAWKFSLDGKLKSAPRIGGIKNFDKSVMGLIPLKIQTWGHWIFINGNLDADPIENSLPDLDQALISRDWNKLSFHSSKEWIINCNWKVYIDNYLDGGYHIPFMHPTLDSQLDMDTYKTELFDTYSIQSSKANNSSDSNSELEFDPSERIGKGSIYAWIFPNFMINVYGPCMDINYVVPMGTNKCKVYYEFFFQGEKGREFIESSIKQADITQVEDIEICESIQIGMDSGMYRPGRYAPEVEKGEYHFHRLLHKYYQ
jgi:choline monooxygenase